MTATITDLTRKIQEGMPGHPTHGRTPVKLVGSLNHWIYDGKPRFNPYDGTQLSFANEQWVLNGNTGTHMDAGWHVDPESEIPADRIPLNRGCGTAIWLDLAPFVSDGSEITPAMLEEAEQNSGERVEEGDIVLIRTGWDETCDSDDNRYLSQHPGLTKESGEWLRNRGAVTVGVDLPTPETHEGAATSPIHCNFLKPSCLGLGPDRFIAIIENLVNIGSIPQHRFSFVGLPLPLDGSSASPIRAIALT